MAIAGYIGITRKISGYLALSQATSGFLWLSLAFSGFLLQVKDKRLSWTISGYVRLSWAISDS